MTSPARAIPPEVPLNDQVRISTQQGNAYHNAARRQLELTATLQATVLKSPPQQSFERPARRNNRR